MVNTRLGKLVWLLAYYYYYFFFKHEAAWDIHSRNQTTMCLCLFVSGCLSVLYILYIHVCLDYNKSRMK